MEGAASAAAFRYPAFQRTYRRHQLTPQLTPSTKARGAVLPLLSHKFKSGWELSWWALQDLNLGPMDYEFTGGF
jgi:hypothetical protein